MNLPGLVAETRFGQREEEQKRALRFRDGVRSRKGQSSWDQFLLEQGGCGSEVWATRQRVLSARSG